MDKIRIRQNYENYERVKKAFKEFVHALVWESMDIDAGVHEDEVNEHIERYCNNYGERIIADTNENVSKFIREQYSRYEVRFCEFDADKRIIEDTLRSFRTNNLSLALKKAAKFYRSARNPQVEVYDNETESVITEWE